MAKILVLDDVSDAAHLIKRILSGGGHEVFPFTEETDALQFVKENKVDLAILDIKLKRMSGVDVLAEIKKIAPSTHAIILTAYPTTETEKEARRLGASEYCVKPIDNTELEETVAKVLGAS